VEIVFNFADQINGTMQAAKQCCKHPVALFREYRHTETIFQTALFQEPGFDSCIADAPPVFIQKTMGFVANPLARLFGLRSCDERYSAQK
jgi:hypothetical protein